MNTRMKLGGQMDGRYKLIATKLDGSTRVVADWFDNLILNAGLDRLGSGGVVSHCQVGTDSTPPSVGQSSLVSALATTSTQQALNYGTAEDASYVYYRKTFRFGVGVAAGNLSEVGVGWASNFMFSRALIKDDLGDPTTVTVLPDEVLDVVYEVRFYQNHTERTATIDISGTDYTFTFRPIGLTGNNSNLVFTKNACVQLRLFLEEGYIYPTSNQFSINWTSYQEGVALVDKTQTDLLGTIVSDRTGEDRNDAFRNAYVANSYERNIRSTFGLNCFLAGKAETAHAGYLLETRCGNYQMLVSPSVPKTDRKVLTLDYTVSWARKAP